MALIGLVTYGDYGIVIVTAHQVIEDIPGETISVARIAKTVHLTRAK